MEVTETLREGLKRTCKITLEADEIDRELTDKLEELRPQIRLRGFRPGKIPVSLLRARYGPELRRETIDEMVTDAYMGFLEESGESPALPPTATFDSVGTSEDRYCVDMVYEVQPDVPDVDLSAITVERVTPSYDEDEFLESSLEEVAERFREDKVEGEEYEAKQGDRICLSYSATMNGKSFDGSEMTDLFVEAGADAIFTDLSSKLLGVKTGQTVEVEAVFPGNPTRGTLPFVADFRCDIKGIQTKVPVEYNDEFAQRIGSADLNDLKSKMLDFAKSEFETMADMIMRSQLIDEVVGVVDFELPPSVVEGEVVRLAEALDREWESETADPIADQAEENGVDQENSDAPGDTDTGAENSGSDHSEEGSGEGDGGNDSYLLDLAKRRVKAMYVFIDVAEKGNLITTDGDVREFLEAKSRNSEEFEQFRQLVEQNEKVKARIMQEILDKRAQDYILELATIETREVPLVEFKETFERTHPFTRQEAKFLSTT